MAHRVIVTLATALMLCFLLLSQLDAGFFMLHLYQSLIWLAIILMLFYLEDRYAYMLGILAPAVWLLITYATGLLGGAARQFARLLHAQRANNQVSLLAGITAILAVLMLGFCAYRWKREYAGTGKGVSTFVVSLLIVVAYYAILVVWFWHSIPQA
jgi:hypothetical protein